MRTRTVVALAFLFASSISRHGGAQSSPNSAGLVRGDYIRVSGGLITPVNPQSSLRQWRQGQSLNVMWENWDTGSGTNVSLLGFGLYGDIGFLPFDSDRFKADFTNGPNGLVLEASAGRARVYQLGVNTRLRVPMPYIMPSVSVGFGYVDWRPAQITYRGERGNGTAKQQNRQGGALTVIGALDAAAFDRFAIFGEALYTYGFTSFGRGLAASGSQCVQQDCDLLKNTPFGVIRGGIRVRTSR